MKKLTLKVEGMTCGHCVSSVEKAVREIGAKGTVNLASHTAEIEFDESRVSLEAIKEAIEEQGFDVAVK